VRSRFVIVRESPAHTVFDPWEDQEALVVDDQMQLSPLLFRRPTDPRISDDEQENSALREPRL